MFQVPELTAAKPSSAGRAAAFVNWPVIRNEMDNAQLDALVACSAASTFYLSGYFNDEQLYVRDQLSMVVVEREGEPTYLISNSEEAMARSTGWLRDVRTYVPGSSPIEALAEILCERGLESARLGLETEFLPIAAYRNLAGRLPNAKLLDSSGVLARARWVKMPAEIERIRDAVVTSDKAVHAALQRCHVGDTGTQVQTKIIEEFIQRGADKFLMRLASGVDTRISHHDPSDRRLERGDLISCTFAGFWDHYWGDNERMGTVGPATPQQRESYQVVYDAVYATVDLIKPGIEVRELYDCPQAAFEKHGDGWRRPHMGHGMPRTRGHEDPMIQPNVHTLLEPNMVFVLEQGYRSRGDRYMLSKLVQVTEGGHKVLDDWWDIKEMFVIE
jgi:Xaa-Pro dipeptidase